MPVKANWQNGEQFNASDANDVAAAVNAAYVKPATGVPITDLSSSVQVSLGKADTALQAVAAVNITDSTATGRAVLTAADAAAARTTLGVAYGTTAGTVVQGNDSRLSPSASSITDSTATGRAVLTAADAAAARTTLGVAYGTAAGTVAQGNDSRITGAEQTANKGVANGYASLDSGGKVPVAQLPNSIMEYQGTYNASTNTPSLANGTGSTGDVYRVSVAGSRNFGAGSISFEVGDYVIYNGTVWEKSDTTDAVSTVAGLTGDVTASALRGAIATGTPSSSTYLRGDGSWATIPASGISRSVSTVTANTTLGSAANTDYVVFSNITATDPNTVALLHLDGANNSTTITDSSLSQSNWTASGDAKLSTAQARFGTASLTLDGTGDFITSASNITFGTNNFTVEMWVRMTSFSSNPNVYDMRAASNSATLGVLQINTSGRLYYEVNGMGRITGTTSMATNTWNHIAICRSGTSTRLFLNGTQEGSTWTDSTNYSGNPHAIGRANLGAGAMNGFVDEVRVSNGTAFYTANFTAPTAAFSDPVIPQLTLPTAVSNSNLYTVKNISSDSLGILRTSNQTIDGASGSVSLTTGSIARYMSDGSNWRTV